MSYNVQQDKFVFGITPAPSPLNPNPINWRAYTNDFADEINVVDEKTNLLVGTIGGPTSYRYQRLPKTTVSVLPYADTATARGAAYNIFLAPTNQPFIFLENGNLAQIDYSYNHFNNGAIIYDCYDVETGDPNNGYWIAFRPSDADATVLEKIAEVKQTDDYYNNGFNYSYQAPNNLNQCKFIRTFNSVSDNVNLFSTITTITISGTSVGSTMTVTEVTNNFGGNTVLSLYNANAPVPVAPGAADWIDRTPYFTGQDDYVNMMNGVDEGWVWYGDGTTPSTLYTYMAGFNILTGATAFISPIAALTATTNFNPAAPVNASNFNPNRWESHPGGVVFFARNGQVLNNQNNTNNVTGIFSPRWTNNKIVVFLNGRDVAFGQFLNTNSDINNLSTTFDGNFGFDGLNLVQYNIYETGFGIGSIMIMYRYALDVENPLGAEAAVTPLANTGYSNFSNYYDWNDGFLVLIESTEQNLNSFNLNTPIWSRSEYLFLPITSTKINQLQSNNNNFPHTRINNRFYSLFNYLSIDSILFGFQYDEYRLV